MAEGAAADPQIGCYLSRQEAADLDAYARAFELSRPKLCVLLVLRELRCRRLRSLKGVNMTPVGKRVGTRVTTRAANEQVKIDFVAHASSLGLGSDQAAAILFRAELGERWLEAALS